VSQIDDTTWELFLLVKFTSKIIDLKKTVNFLLNR
jgi:hypothetical protein